jgi:STE24 endopeptidase
MGVAQGSNFDHSPVRFRRNSAILVNSTSNKSFVTTNVSIPVQADSPEARRYNRIRRWLGIADFIIGLVFLIVLLVTGWSGWLRDLAYRLGFQNYSLAVFVYLLLLLLSSKALGIGLDYYGYRLERRYKLSTQRFRAWIWDEVKGFLVGLVLGGAVVELLYYTIRQWPERWWLLAWALFMVLFVLLAQLAPVALFPIFYKFEPLDDEELRRRLVMLSERAGTRVRGVYRWKLSEKSKKANAALTGLGATRRIILADTLLDNYTSDEIEAVLAHELGHHVHRHILKSIFVQAAITLFGFWAANWALHYAVDRQLFEFVQVSDFANLPLLALVATVLSFLLMPALNAYSRYNERQADRYAFESIASVEPFISSMNKLAEQNLAERTPGKWVEWFFHSHPSISRRLAAADEWGRTQTAHPHI